MDGLDEMSNAVRLEIRYTAVEKMEFKFIWLATEKCWPNLKKELVTRLQKPWK